MKTVSLSPSVEFDARLIRKLDRLGPRYTSYPSADRFHNEFSGRQYGQAVMQRKLLGNRRPLSLYVHIPFCQSVCYYCACNKVVTKDRSRAAEYLDFLSREIEMHAALLGSGKTSSQLPLSQLHLGGGTPTYLNHAQLEHLLAVIQKFFPFAPDAQGEFSIEVDPRTVNPERIAQLRQLGFNRLSLGVQDFDPDVQKAVHREQGVEETLALIEAARRHGFHSVSVDLIYGLPLQNVISFNRTLSTVIDAAPDRIAIYNYAHLPERFKPQRRIAVEQLPSPDTKLDLLKLCIKRLTEAGYVYIGMDHFAKPNDSLAVAQRQGRLHRNFQGYSTFADSDLIAVGASAIGAIGATYSQNEKELPAYYERLNAGELPIARGLVLSHDDLLRRTVIHTLLCHFELNLSAVEAAFGIDFCQYFSNELEQLKTFEEEGLVSLEQGWLMVSVKGRLLIRNIVMVFDRYLQQAQATLAKYSRTI